jgi:hypothetical protein
LALNYSGYFLQRPATTEELTAIMAADTGCWAPIIKASGFTADDIQAPPESPCVQPGHISELLEPVNRVDATRSTSAMTLLRAVA